MRREDGHVTSFSSFSGKTHVNAFVRLDTIFRLIFLQHISFRFYKTQNFQLFIKVIKNYNEGMLCCLPLLFVRSKFTYDNPLLFQYHWVIGMVLHVVINVTRCGTCVGKTQIAFSKRNTIIATISRFFKNPNICATQ